MERRKTTDSDSQRAHQLTPQQEAALDLLAIGNIVSQVAEAVGVSRQTVSQWLNRNNTFKAALNRRRKDLWDQLADRTRALLPKALDALERALDGNGKAAQDAAIQLLKACGMYGMERPEGCTDADGLLIADRERAENRRVRSMYTSL